VIVKVFEVTERVGGEIERASLVIEREGREMESGFAVMFEVEEGRRREKKGMNSVLIGVR